MRQATRKLNKPKTSTLSWHLAQRVREGVLILVVTIAMFLLLALTTYHSTDPGWSETGQTQVVANAGGRVGAWFADVMLYLFGIVAYLFPLMLLYGAWVGFSQRLDAEDPWQRWFLLLRSIGMLMIMASGSAIAALDLHILRLHLPFTAGGVLGNVVGENMQKVFNPIGGGVMLWAIFLVGITLFAGVSWLKIAEKVGAWLLASATRAWQSLLTKLRRLKPEENVEEEATDKPQKVQKPQLTRANSGRIEPTINSMPSKSASTMLSAAAPVMPPKPIIAAPKKIEPSLRAQKERQVPLFESAEGPLPPLSLLDMPEESKTTNYSSAQLESMSRDVELRLQDFGIEVKVVAVHPGPVVTRFELQLAAGTKVSRISNLAKDLARSLSVTSVRIVEVIPGKSVIGLELPNDHREVVRLREILSSQQYDNARSPITLALGKDIAGHPVIVDLAKMPHLLVAGTTGSGKSVGLNAMLLSLLYKSTPKDLRLIMIDPKMLELAVYDAIPHLLVPVVTDMKEAANALRWCVAEMERRYKLMAALGVRNIAGYNSKVREAEKKGQPIFDPIWKGELGTAPILQELPCIVVLADEFADMMMVVGKKVEELIARLAQKARAAGIHLILATQRPSVDVITGLIKANIPTRIAFQVSSKIDSRTILDQSGAEQLLGHGDMLYLAPGTGVPVRVHGANVLDDEVHRVVEYLKSRSAPEYIEEILAGDPTEAGEGSNNGASDAEQDPLYDQAVELVIETRRASISSIQRRFKIGYNRAARLVEAMEAAGLVSAMDNSGTREVLVPAGVN